MSMNYLKYTHQAGYTTNFGLFRTWPGLLIRAGRAAPQNHCQVASNCQLQTDRNLQLAEANTANGHYLANTSILTQLASQVNNSRPISEIGFTPRPLTSLCILSHKCSRVCRSGDTWGCQGSDKSPTDDLSQTIQ